MAKTSPTTVVDVYYLTYRDGVSDKFYQVAITEDGTCILRWGRRGAARGQTSTSVMPTYEAAHDLGLRQVYAKKSKGYVEEHASKYVIETKYVTYAKEQNPHPLFDAIDMARSNGAYTGLKDAVLTHYNDLLDRAHNLMARADGMDFEQVAEEFEHLEKAWAEIEERHAEISISMGIAKTTFTKKLLGI